MNHIIFSKPVLYSGDVLSFVWIFVLQRTLFGISEASPRHLLTETVKNVRECAIRQPIVCLYVESQVWGFAKDKINSLCLKRKVWNKCSELHIHVCLQEMFFIICYTRFEKWTPSSEQFFLSYSGCI